SKGLQLDKKLAHLIVERAGVDQWDLTHALDKLALVPLIDEETIVSLIDARPVENVFNLFETALNGEHDKLHQAIATLELSEDPYKLFALLSSQAFQLSAVAAAKSGDKPSSDFGIHPFVASKLSAQAKKLTPNSIKKII